jgi:hypothetical protein
LLGKLFEDFRRRGVGDLPLCHTELRHYERDPMKQNES